MMERCSNPELRTRALGIVRRSLRACAAVFAAGCTTAYGPSGDSPYGGYSEIELSPDLYQVRFVPRGGLSVDTWDTLRAYALLRCAELTLEGGHRYFIVEGDEAGDSEGLGIEGLLSHWEATSPRTERIKTFHENPDTGSTTVYDAAAVVRTVRAKYELD